MSDPTETSAQTFIVKIWPEAERNGPRWRGQVTHVPSGSRRYVDDLTEITDFIATYCAEMGAPGIRR